MSNAISGKRIENFFLMPYKNFYKCFIKFLVNHMQISFVNKVNIYVERNDLFFMKAEGGMREGGVDAYRYMLEQNVGKSVLEFQVNRWLDRQKDGLMDRLIDGLMDRLIDG